MKRLSITLLFLVSAKLFAQNVAPLTVEKIMRNPQWLGVAPSNVAWSLSSNKVYFNWNPDKKTTDPLFSIGLTGAKPQVVSDAEEQSLNRRNVVFNKKNTQALFERNGDLFLLDIVSGKEKALSNTVERESNATFSGDERAVIFQKGENLFSISLVDGSLTQLSNFSRAKKRGEASLSRQDQWLKNDQVQTFDFLRQEAAQQKIAEAERKANEPARPKEFSLDDKSSLSSIKTSPDMRYLVFKISKNPEGNQNTIVPNYITASGYVEDIPGRTKVGNQLATYQSYVYDRNRDTIFAIATKDIPGIKDLPDYLKDYPKQLEERTKKNEDRKVSIVGPYWNDAGTQAVVLVYALDNKDRWVMQLDPSTGQLSLLDRQRDEAWIGGPGIGGSFGGANIGWINNETIYYQSEASGYSHIYTQNISGGAKKQLTSGKWEVQSLRLSTDKKTFYFSANKQHPGITHFYRMPTNGGEITQLTSMKGGNEVSLSPDEKWLAIRYSYSNKPWELYLQENKVGAKAKQITQSTSAEFNSYAWREPAMISFKNRYGADVYARLYVPAKPHPDKPAVVFVHGAGYLQNVHYWWSQYFREFMFNNLLTDAGYTVLDIDYTASSGYGRNHRTGIYRHMGGKDLSDQVDGVKLLVEKYGVNPKHVGLYGGSYGGFITLMGLLTEPEVFSSGAALRSVTDWAHYNHGYTSNILNEPALDEKAYKLSSPIYFADGLKGNLLMCHGMVDENVQFQDIVRFSQRLIELGKNKWELAVYPVEDHGFTEPASWTDEYKRIFNLFERTLKPSTNIAEN
jgi:dipeptidyl aminopeptidase/acylaminoacyl peptidase